MVQVAPETRKQQLDLLVYATHEAMQPGFVSANFHKGSDGARVVNYAQWASKEAFESMLKTPEARLHKEAVARFATYDTHLYEVWSTRVSAD